LTREQEYRFQVSFTIQVEKTIAAQSNEKRLCVVGYGISKHSLLVYVERGAV
jgi:hypothetical protein